MAEHRTIAKLIRFRASELARITKQAHACGRTTACFIREASLGLLPGGHGVDASDPLLAELARVGGHLEHLANEARGGWNAGLSERVSTALGEYQTVVRHILLDPRLCGPTVVN
jgi:mobilization protein NikA